MLPYRRPAAKSPVYRAHADPPGGAKGAPWEGRTYAAQTAGRYSGRDGGPGRVPAYVRESDACADHGTRRGTLVLPSRLSDRKDPRRVREHEEYPLALRRADRDESVDGASIHGGAQGCDECL